MKVFNLSCERDHSFEGWFASAEEYDSQLARGLIECPVCGVRSIRKMPAAPRLNLSSAPPPPVADGADGSQPAPTREQAQAMWRKVARFVLENTEDVGERFVEEARRIHYDETPARGIRGVASREAAAELAEEGIEVFAFPLPKRPSGPLQ